MVFCPKTWSPPLSSSTCCSNQTLRMAITPRNGRTLQTKSNKGTTSGAHCIFTHIPCSTRSKPPLMHQSLEDHVGPWAPLDPWWRQNQSLLRNHHIIVHDCQLPRLQKHSKTSNFQIFEVQYIAAAMDVIRYCVCRGSLKDIQKSHVKCPLPCCPRHAIIHRRCTWTLDVIICCLAWEDDN